MAIHCTNCVVTWTNMTKIEIRAPKPKNQKKNDWNNNIIQYLVRSSLMATKNVLCLLCRCCSPPKIIMINIFTETEICQNVCWVHRQLPSSAPSHSQSRWFYFSSTNETHMLIIECHSKQRTKTEKQKWILDKNVCLAKNSAVKRSQQAARVIRDTKWNRFIWDSLKFTRIEVSFNFSRWPHFKWIKINFSNKIIRTMLLNYTQLRHAMCLRD